ncbi:MAG: protein-disulfide isomerase [Acidimicrobiaceae bacterium]|nr:protein-disulfide isomerase [Acidimicrobiaceae bacterium]
MSTLKFSVNWDYRCPFARIINEHIVIGLQHGADWQVDFIPFSLTEVHTEENAISSWEDPSKADELRAVQAGIVIMKEFPEAFREFHLLTFSIRHDQAKDLRNQEVLAEAISQVRLDPNHVFAEIESGWPLKEYRMQHEESVNKFSVFGVPTIFVDDKAAFVRLMTRADGNPKTSIKYIEQIIDQIANHSDINELKHTTLSN